MAEQNVAREPKVAIQSWNARSCTKPAETRFVQLSMGRFVIGGAPQKVDSVSNPTRKQVVLRSCANLLVSAFSSERFQALTATHLSAGVAEWHDDGEHTARVSCEKMYQFVAAIFDDLEQMLVSQGEDRYPSLVALVDDVLSLIYSEPTHSALRSTASTILLYKEDSIKAMVQNLYRVFKEHCQDAGDDVRLQQGGELEAEPGDVLSSLKNSSLPKKTDVGILTRRRGSRALPRINQSWSERWCRRWLLDPTSLSIRPTFDPLTNSAHANLHSFKSSLPSVLALTSLFASLDMTMEGLSLAVEAVMHESAPLQLSSSTILELDGQTHPFELVPDCVRALAASFLFGVSWNISTYSGCVAEVGRMVNILLTTVPQLQANQRFKRPCDCVSDADLKSEAHQLRIKLFLNGDSHTENLDLVVEISVASRQALQTGGRSSMNEYLVHDSSIQDRSVVRKIHATYVAVP